MRLEDFDTEGVSDFEGELKDRNEIIRVLMRYRQSMSTHAMSDHALFLQGKSEMIDEVIEFMEQL